MLRFPDHTQLYTHTQPVGLLWTSDQPIAVAATYTTHKKQTRRISMPSGKFEPAITAVKWLWTALTAWRITTHHYAWLLITSLAFYQTHAYGSLLPILQASAVCTYHETNESSHTVYLFIYCIYLFIYLQCFHNFARCFVWMWNLVADIAGGT